MRLRRGYDGGTVVGQSVVGGRSVGGKQKQWKIKIKK